MVARNVTLREILGESRRVAVRHAGWLASVVLAIAASYSTLDLLEATSGSFIISIIVSVFVQYSVVARLLGDGVHGEGESEGRRYGSMFGAGFISGMGIIVGLLLLIVPGLYLASRWLMVSQYVVAERRSALDALGASWEATAESPTPYFLALLVVAAPFLPLVGLLFWAESIGASEATWEIVATNLVVGAMLTIGWTIGTAAYRVTVGNRRDLQDVFA